MAVIRQFPENAGCPVCSSLVDLPHDDLNDCRIALVKEMDVLLRRARQITARRRDLTEKRLNELNAKFAKQRNARRKRSK